MGSQRSELPSLHPAPPGWHSADTFLSESPLNPELAEVAFPLQAAALCNFAFFPEYLKVTLFVNPPDEGYKSWLINMQAVQRGRISNLSC